MFIFSLDFKTPVPAKMEILHTHGALAFTFVDLVFAAAIQGTRLDLLVLKTRGDFIPGALVFIAVTEGRTLDHLAWYPGGLAFLGPMGL